MEPGNSWGEERISFYSPSSAAFSAPPVIMTEGSGSTGSAARKRGRLVQGIQPKEGTPPSTDSPSQSDPTPPNEDSPPAQSQSQSQSRPQAEERHAPLEVVDPRYSPSVSRRQTQFVSLSFSGGGIRASSFACGALACALDQEFSISRLSCVSGGGFVGSAYVDWLTEEAKSTGVRKSMEEGVEEGATMGGLSLCLASLMAFLLSRRRARTPSVRECVCQPLSHASAPATVSSEPFCSPRVPLPPIQWELEWMGWCMWRERRGKNLHH